MSRFFQSVVSPLAQTFFVKSNMTQGASSLFLGEVDLFFSQKSASRGVTVEIRTVINGYPSSEVLPFARKHLTSAQVNTSETSTTATTFRFDNPIKLLTETEYALVVIPDAADPDYILYTSVVGEEDIATGIAVNQDWGDGVLFTSTNNSAWKSQQSEDLKFTLKRYEFTSTSGHVNLIPNDVEFFQMTGVVGEFRHGEPVYAEKGPSTAATVSGSTVTIGNNTPGFVEGDYIVLRRGAEVFASRIVSLVTGQSQTTIEMEGPAFSLTSDTSTQSLTAHLAVGGIVTHYDKRTGIDLYLSESSAREGAIFEDDDVVRGFATEAYGTISSVVNKPISFIQPIVFTSNGTKTLTSLQAYDGEAFDQNLTTSDNNYLLGQQRYINSKSNDNGAESDFVIRVNMSNNGFTRATPIVDHDLSMIHAYKYEITDQPDSSSYVAKEVFLQDDMSAQGFKVLLSAYRPIGTVVDVYARFRFITNMEAKSDWILLENDSPSLYSNTFDVYDYRDFVYDLDEDAYPTEFTSFQIKIVLRHATNDELGNIDVDPTENVFPHINDYRAIALT